MATSAPMLDLFGYVAPASVRRSRGRPTPSAAPLDEACDELAASIDAALSRLSDEVTSAISVLQDQLVGLVDDDNAGEVDTLFESLDEELTEAVRRVRQVVLR